MNVKDANMGEVLPEHDKQKHSQEALSARSGETQTLSYEELLTSFKKGLRNGNWRKLNRLDKALYRALLWYTKHRESIINALIVEKLLGLVKRLKETKSMKIFRGLKKVITQLKKGEEEIVARAPQLKVWRKDPDYIFWLGTKR